MLHRWLGMLLALAAILPLDSSAQNVVVAPEPHAVCGIGAVVRMVNDVPLVVQLMPHAQASAAGMKVGDSIIGVAGKSVAKMTLIDVVDLIRGPEGSKVQLTIMRPGSVLPLSFTVERAPVQVQ